ncbi:hypothetical protein PDTK01_22870 [Phycicoccus sp. DTK01]|nr:hypothetical protein PDTK01_22870 [Phycicoccus sp. DTK01]
MPVGRLLDPETAQLEVDPQEAADRLGVVAHEDEWPVARSRPPGLHGPKPRLLASPRVAVSTMTRVMPPP